MILSATAVFPTPPPACIEIMLWLFKELRIEGIGTTDLKAMMTENNAVWTSVALCEELKREHAAILAMQEKKREEMKKKNQ